MYLIYITYANYSIWPHLNILSDGCNFDNAELITFMERIGQAMLLFDLIKLLTLERFSCFYFREHVFERIVRSMSIFNTIYKKDPRVIVLISKTWCFGCDNLYRIIGVLKQRSLN